MLEALVIMFLIAAIKNMPLRGKTLDQLSEKQREKLEKNFSKQKNMKKSKLAPDMTLEGFLPVAQKQGLSSLIGFFVTLALWVLVLLYVYPNLLLM